MNKYIVIINDVVCVIEASTPPTTRYNGPVWEYTPEKYDQISAEYAKKYPVYIVEGE